MSCSALWPAGRHHALEKLGWGKECLKTPGLCFPVWWDAAPSRACQEGAGAEHAATSLQLPPSNTSREDICNS